MPAMSVSLQSLQESPALSQTYLFNGMYIWRRFPSHKAWDALADSRWRSDCIPACSLSYSCTSQEYIWVHVRFYPRERQCITRNPLWWAEYQKKSQPLPVNSWDMPCSSPPHVCNILETSFKSNESKKPWGCITEPAHHWLLLHHRCPFHLSELPFYLNWAWDTSWASQVTQW